MTCIPEQPVHRSEAERVVWEATRKQLRPGDVLIAGQRCSDAHGDWEADLVLLLPEGFVVIEVKGGHVSRSRGQWWQATPEGPRRIDPETQVVRVKKELHRWLMRQPEWSRGRVRMAHLVALPDTPLAAYDPSPGLPRRWVLDRDQVDQVHRTALQVLTTEDLAIEPEAGPGDYGVELAAWLIAGRADPGEEISGRVEQLELHADRLTAEQTSILAMVGLGRYQVRGGPGTGKTWLAVEQARRWADSGQRVAFVCYSRGLSTWVQRLVSRWPAAMRERIVVRTFHSLGLSWGAKVPDEAPADYWETDLPELMRALARDLPDDQRFDALVVDESQDFPDAWWQALFAAMRDPEGSRLAVFGDDGQRVFGRRGGPEGLHTLELTRNLRNTAEIVDVFRPLAASYQQVLGGVGWPVRFIECSDEEAHGVASDAAAGLLDEGWDPRQVAVLTTFHRHPMQVERVEYAGRDGYWDEFWTGDDFFHSTVAGFKGLERPAIVLAVDGFRDPQTARDMLCVGLSRARDLLVVCGSSRTIRAAVGDSVADRLLARRA